MDASFCVAKKADSVLPSKYYKIQKVLKGINFILHLSYLSDILGVMNHCNCYPQGPGSNIVDFAIKSTTSGVGKVRLASHTRLFDPRDAALQVLVRNTEDLFLFCNCTTRTPISSSCVVEDFFFCSFTHRRSLFDCCTFPQVALSMKLLPSLRVPSSKSSIHSNDSHIVRFLRSLKLCCPEC